MSSKNSFLKGAAVLVAANFIVKFIGVIYKIPLGNLIAGDGMAYFSAAFEIYQLLLAFSTAGLPVAVSKMVSESYALGRYSEVNKIFKVALATFVGVGLFGSFIMYCGAGFFSELIEMPMAKLSIQVLSPAVFFFSIVAIYRGYFQGMQNMNPTALTQILEAVFKLFIGIGLTIVVINLGFSSEVQSATAIFGTTFSTIIAATLLILIYRSKLNREKVINNELLGGEIRTSKRIVSDLIKIVIPVTIGSLVVNLTGFLDLFLIMNRLVASGVSEQVAEFAYGSYKGYAYTLFNLPPSIIASVNVTLIPIISAAFAVGDREKLQYIINKALKVIIIFTLPCAVGLMSIPGPILTMLYPTKPDEVAIATPLLLLLGLATLWTTLSSLTTVMLQAAGKINLPIISIIVGGVIKLISNYILIGNPNIGIIGATISTNLCYFVMLIINMHNIKKYTQTKISLVDSFARPILSAVLMGVATITSFKLLNNVLSLSNSVSTVITIGVAAVVYLFLIIFTGAITKEDLNLIPGGSKLSRLIRR
ncbi:MAG: polysaccharide biosynthesis protein [Clostridia bacterium]